jgi:hypothetical protein
MIRMIAMALKVLPKPQPSTSNPPTPAFSQLQFQMSLLGWPDALVLAHHHGGVTVTRIENLKKIIYF